MSYEPRSGLGKCRRPWAEVLSLWYCLWAAARVYTIHLHTGNAISGGWHVGAHKRNKTRRWCMGHRVPFCGTHVPRYISMWGLLTLEYCLLVLPFWGSTRGILFGVYGI